MMRVDDEDDDEDGCIIAILASSPSIIISSLPINLIISSHLLIGH